MSVIVPTITTSNPAEFTANLTAFMSFTKRIQVDFSDGTFAPTMMVPLGTMHFPENAVIDLHLMSAKPSQHLTDVLALKPALCILHVEADDDLVGVIQQLRAANIKIGLAFLKGTYPGHHRDLIASADHLMIFAGTLGEQGGAIDFLQIEKVPLLKELRPEAEIGWDGGVNLSNVRALAHAGVDVINVGSAITRASDRASMFQSLSAEAEKKGVLV